MLIKPTNKTMYLTTDAVSSKGITYAKSGDKVIMKFTDEVVAIVERCDGERFPVAVKKLTDEKPVDNDKAAKDQKNQKSIKQPKLF